MLLPLPPLLQHPCHQTPNGPAQTGLVPMRRGRGALAGGPGILGARGRGGKGPGGLAVSPNAAISRCEFLDGQDGSRVLPAPKLLL